MQLRPKGSPDMATAKTGWNEVSYSYKEVCSERVVWALLELFELFSVFFLLSSFSLPVRTLLCGCQLPLCRDIMISVQTAKIKPPLLHVKRWINHVFHLKRSKFCRQTDVSEKQNTQESTQSLTLISWLFLWIAQDKKTEWKMLRWTIKLSTV